MPGRPSLEEVVSKIINMLGDLVSVAVFKEPIVEAMAAAGTDFDGDVLENGAPPQSC